MDNGWESRRSLLGPFAVRSALRSPFADRSPPRSHHRGLSVRSAAPGTSLRHWMEGKLRKLKQDMGIDSYLTGISGGVRYAPVVRYSKVHLYMAPEDIQEAVGYLGIKEVDSGANVVIFPLENDSYIKGCRIIKGDMVVSPLQVYLDSLQLRGRGEEMAEAVLKKEIIR